MEQVGWQWWQETGEAILKGGPHAGAGWDFQLMSCPFCGIRGKVG